MATKILTSKATTMATQPAPEKVAIPDRIVGVLPKSAPATAAPKKSDPTTEAIRTRAYFIWLSSRDEEFKNWIRAEQELSDV